MSNLRRAGCVSNRCHKLQLNGANSLLRFALEHKSQTARLNLV